MKKFLKFIKFFIIFLIILLLAVFILSRGKIYGADELAYGLTFSKKQAESLGLDWRQLYSEILNDLGVKKIRLVAYWDEVEPAKGEYFWDDLDWQLEQADAAGAEMVLSMGRRLPRWPECHLPDWARDLSEAQKQANILEYIREVILRYNGHMQITAWQVENEPFLPYFGECPLPDAEFLDEEIALVKTLDDRPVVISDSGELSLWVPAARRADIFGTTMYRDTYSQQLQRYIHYPVTPGFFRLKKNIAGWFARPDKWIVIELQAEPWGPVPFQNLSEEERSRTMNLEKFREILEFSRKAGFREFYLWGVEWWAWERAAQNNPDLWNEAKTLFK